MRMSVFVRRRHRYSKPAPIWLVALECGMLLWWLPVIIVTPFVKHWLDGKGWWIVISALLGALMAAICYWGLRNLESARKPKSQSPMAEAATATGYRKPKKSSCEPSSP